MVTTTLRRGDSGEDVRTLQQALVDNNFYPDASASNNGVDGSFGEKTEDAVIRFQIMNGLEVDGVAGPATLRALGIYGSGGSDGGSGGGSSETLRPGDSGAAVRQLQEALVEAGFYPDRNAPNNGVDGSYGPNTEDAVRRYQTMNGLTVDGIAGPATLSSLGISGGSDGGSGGGSGSTLRPGHTGNAVRELQQALVDAGFYPDRNASNNGVDGVYGANTLDAVRRYQIMNGLQVDGIAGPQTLSSLGLSGGSGGGNGGGTGGSPNTLRRGDQGEAVRMLQQALVDNNFYPDRNAANYGVDGHFGAKTEDAVRRYQTMNGLAVDGVAGPATLSSLNITSGSGGSGGGSEPDPGTNPDPEGGSGGGSDEAPGGGNIGDLKINQRFIPSSNGNRPGYIMSPDYITIHETANTASGATASMHANYVRNASTPTSWHFTVDDSDVIYQHLPLNETGFHAGDGSGDGNRNSIGIELCVNSGGDFAQTRKNAAALVRQLMSDLDISLSNVVTHNHWSGKACPANLLNIFDEFLDQVMDSNHEPEPEDDDEDNGSGGEDENEEKEIVITSPFVNHLEEKLKYREDSNATISYSRSFNVELGPFSGTLSGTLSVGNPSESVWDLPADKAIDGNLLGNSVTQAITEIASHINLPVLSEYQDARDYINQTINDDLNEIIQVRFDGPNFSLTLDDLIDDFPYLNWQYFSLEVSRKIADNLYTIEKMTLDDIDFNRVSRTFATTGVVLACVLIVGGLIYVGVPVSVLGSAAAAVGGFITTMLSSDDTA